MVSRKVSATPSFLCLNLSSHHRHLILFSFLRSILLCATLNSSIFLVIYLFNCFSYIIFFLGESPVKNDIESMMGKKKKKVVKKTELSIALAESSSTIAKAQTPRKRGRPRKIIEKSDEEGQRAEEFQDFEGTVLKKAKTSDEEEDIRDKVEETVGSSEKEEMVKVEDNHRLSSKQQLAARRSSRATRKSKPRKSS